MTKLIKKISFILILTCIVNCTNKKSQNGLDSDLKIKVDTIAVKGFLKDPRNNLTIDKLEYKTECKPSKNQNPNDLKVTLKEYQDCKYIYKGEKIAEIKFSVFKMDSTWSFGTNGLEIHHFETDKRSFPLKNELKIGSTIQDFKEVFGIPKKLTDKYSYDFKFELFSSKLILEYDKNIVTKIIVINNVYN